jgi:hypothetical protein
MALSLQSNSAGAALDTQKKQKRSPGPIPDFFEFTGES